METLTLYLIAFIILFIVAIILSLTPLLTFHQKLHKIIFHQKLHNNNILALTHLLQTKNISKTFT